MAAKKLDHQTVAIIEAINHATAAAQIVADHVAQELKDHTLHDDERFEQVTKLIESIAQDVKSLLGSRSYMRGAWKGMTVAVVAALGVAKFVHDYWDAFITLVKGH